MKRKPKPPKKGTKIMRQTGLYLGVEQLRQAQELARRDGVSLSEIVRRALDFYLTLKASGSKEQEKRT
jgi:hypothetical protein